MGTIRVRVGDSNADGSNVSPQATDGEGVEVKEMFGGGGVRVVPFDTAELAASLQGLSGQLGELFGGLREVAGFELQQVQIGLEVSAEGGFNLIGNAKAGGKGVITLSFAPGPAADKATDKAGGPLGGQSGGKG